MPSSKSNSPYEVLSRRFAHHDRHAILSALFCLAGTLICWQLIWFLFRWLAWFLLSSAFGDEAKLPEKLSTYYGLLMAVIYGWAIIDSFRRHYESVVDRPAIGWRLFKELFLALPKMTFAVVGNLGAIVRLSRSETKKAWTLLESIHEAGKATFSDLTLQEPDVRIRMRLLQALQLVGIIDFHTSRDSDFFYMIRSDQTDWIDPLMRQSDPPSDTDTIDG